MTVSFSLPASSGPRRSQEFPSLLLALEECRATSPAAGARGAGCASRVPHGPNVAYTEGHLPRAGLIPREVSWGLPLLAEPRMLSLLLRKRLWQPHCVFSAHLEPRG